MKYKGNPQFDHAQPSRTGILLMNLGTPEAPDRKSLKVYLRQFLSDPRVVEVPRVVWWLVLHLVILRIRPRRSAAAYQSVWTEEGSPLEVHTRGQADRLRERLERKYGEQVVVEWAMRYGRPSVSEKLDQLMKEGVTRLLVVPLYPQYSGATTGSAFDALADDFTRRRWLPELRFVSSYHDFDPYIDALVQSIRAHWDTHGRAQKLIFSYHGVPLRYLHQGDPYHCQCLKTSRLVADRLGLEEEAFMTTFQSRFGKAKWLQPYTDMVMKTLPEQNVRSVQVVCPGFSSDCLETIEEIGVENRDYFLQAGGERYEYIPALNQSDVHMDMLEQLVEYHAAGWRWSRESSEELKARLSRVEACPYNRL